VSLTLEVNLEQQVELRNATMACSFLLKRSDSMFRFVKIELPHDVGRKKKSFDTHAREKRGAIRFDFFGLSR
jgi:hypothetical protein